MYTHLKYKIEDLRKHKKKKRAKRRIKGKETHRR